jgi:hypothetical protein
MPLGTGHDAPNLIYDKILQRELSLFRAFRRHGWGHERYPLAVKLCDALRAAIMAVTEHASGTPLTRVHIGNSRG